MKKVLMICAVLVLCGGAGWAGEKVDSKQTGTTFTTFANEAITYIEPDPGDRMIIFGDTPDGKLDIKLEGYTGMTQAAEDFFNHLIQIYAECNCKSIFDPKTGRTKPAIK